MDAHKIADILFNLYRVDGEVVPEKELFLTMEEIEEHFKEDELVCCG